MLKKNNRYTFVVVSAGHGTNSYNVVCYEMLNELGSRFCVEMGLLHKQARKLSEKMSGMSQRDADKFFDENKATRK